jgi:hypothetical protein
MAICKCCEKEVGIHHCNGWCSACTGGPIRRDDRGIRPFMQAVGSRVNCTEAYRDDVRKRKIERATRADGSVFTHVTRAKPRVAYVYGR